MLVIPFATEEMFHVVSKESHNNNEIIVFLIQYFVPLLHLFCKTFTFGGFFACCSESGLEHNSVTSLDFLFPYHPAHINAPLQLMQGVSDKW